MDHFNIVLLMLIGGAVLLCVGYQHRENNAGIFVLWLGAIAMLSTMFYAIFKAIGL